MNATTLSLKLPARLATKIKLETKKRSLTKSDLIREALEQYFDKKKNKANKPVLLDLGRDLCGSVSGPEDLSTNSKYLENLGE